MVSVTVPVRLFSVLVVVLPSGFLVVVVLVLELPEKELPLEEEPPPEEPFPPPGLVGGAVTVTVMGK